jgi:hypothetical protein
MTKWKKICFWLTSILAGIIILMVSLHLFVIRGISLEPIKERLLEDLCRKAECQVDLGEFEIFLLPAPHITASQVRIFIPGRSSGTVKSLSIFPRILPLFNGRFELAKLQLTNPDLKIIIPDVTEGKHLAGVQSESGRNEAMDIDISNQKLLPGHEGTNPVIDVHSQPSSSLSIGTPFQAILAAMVEKAPGLHLHIEQGRIDVFFKTQSLIMLQELSADMVLPPNELHMKLECKSDHWEKFALDVSFDLMQSKGKGHIALDHFRSQIVGQYLPYQAPKPVDESPIHLHISFSSEGPGAFIANFRASSPSLALQKGNEKSVLKNANLNGTLQMAADTMQVRVARLDLEDPRLSLSGQFLSRQEPPEVSYHIECNDTDATSVRKVVLALVGESPEVQDIFQIIRGGRVPLLVFDAQGSSTEDLQKAQNLLVRGNLEAGEVFIEKINLMVNEAKGDVLIAHGILEAKNLQGRAGASTGRNGSLTVPLTKGNGPFHLDIEIDADLAQLPPVLSRVVDNQDFLRELALLRDVAGRANGRLILGETLSSILTRVEVNEWVMRGKYQRIPFPLELQAQSFFYQDSSVSVKSLQGRAGKSKWYDVSGSFDWSRGPVLELESSTRGRICLDELFPWFMTFPNIREKRWDIDSLKGTFRIDTLAFEGLLSHPRDWRLLLNGRIEEVTSRSGKLKDTLYIKSGSIVATQQNLQAVNCDLTYLDASLVASGELIGNFKDFQSADLSFRGTMGLQAGEWLFDLIHLPVDLRARTPLSTPGMNLRWTKNDHTTILGTLRVDGGPEVSMDVDQGSQQLSINQLTIRDAESDASFTATIEEAEVGLGFKGNLATGTLDRLLTESRRFSGSVAGDLSAHLVLDRLANSTANGKLSIRDFLYIPAPGMPVRVENASLESKGATLEVHTATLRVMDTPFEVKGNVGIAEGHLRVDLDLLADGINWDELKAISSLEKMKNAPDFGLLETQLRGEVRVNSGYFTLDHYTWKPLRAKLVFAQDGINTQVTEANLCTIPTPATTIPSSQGQLLITKLDARNLSLDPTLACLWDRKGLITGVFDLEGEISALVTKKDMSNTLEGKLDLLARNGRVYHSTVLTKIFDLLNVTEIYRGQLPDLTHEGCAYESIKAGATLKKGKLLLKQAVFDGLCAKMVGSGEVDLTTQKINITILVSPLKTVDSVVRNIPLVGSILGGSLVSIPVRVTGDLSNPTVIPLSPSAVGEGLVNYMKRVFQLPFKLMQPLQ